jgi:hypothetical protein
MEAINFLHTDATLVDALLLHFEPALTKQQPRRIMDDSDSSGLSSAPPSDDEKPLAPIFAKMAKGKKAAPRKKKAPVTPPTPPSPPRPQRSPSPPHEESLADNPDVAVC